MSEHLLEMAKALVRVKDGEIEVLTDPQISRCPLRQDLYGLDPESRNTVEAALKQHMRELGMYGHGRVLELHEKPVSFGASEIVADAMSEGLVDAAVVVCEGAGTVILTRPEVMQAVGAHMTGLVETSPIEEIQTGLERRGCLLLDRQCNIDQVKGFEMAAEAGFERIAVTIAGTRAFEAEKLREKGRGMGNRPIILAVHTTGIGEAEARALAENCDIVWACASKAVRNVVGPRARLQIGVSIPVFALTDEGKRLVLNRAQHFEGSLVIHRAGLPLAPLGKQPEPLI
jgi:putative methanogenesis marker protein 8